jgi:hypothetical protein
MKLSTVNPRLELGADDSFVPRDDVRNFLLLLLLLTTTTRNEMK